MTIALGNVKVIADLVEFEMLTDMNFREIGRKIGGKSEYRISLLVCKNKKKAKLLGSS